MTTDTSPIIAAPGALLVRGSELAEAERDICGKLGPITETILGKW